MIKNEFLGQIYLDVLAHAKSRLEQRTEHLIDMNIHMFCENLLSKINESILDISIGERFIINYPPLEISLVFEMGIDDITLITVMDLCNGKSIKMFKGQTYFDISDKSVTLNKFIDKNNKQLLKIIA